MEIADLPPITRAERGLLDELTLTCHDCGVLFTTTDPDRKWCDLHMVERVNGAGILEDDGDDDALFTTLTLICSGCGIIFESPRRVERCAECNAGVKALVTCPACDLEHRVPVLSPTKLCGPCRLDPVMTRMSLESRLAAAQCHADEAWLRLDADLAHADAPDRARYDAACERAAEWSADRWARARDAAIAKGDGLAPLLIARQKWDEAAAELDRVRAQVARGLEEVERAREL